MNLKYIFKLRYVLAFFGIFLFIITIYGLEFFELIMGFFRHISLYWKNIAFFIIGLCIIALFVNMTEHYILHLGGYIEPPDNIRASESLSKKMIKLFKREKWTVIYSFLLVSLIYIFSYVLPQYVLLYFTIYYLVVIIIPFILLSHRLRETHPKVVKYIGSLPSILSICFLLLIWYYLRKSDVLLYTCYISGILISIAYYWYRIPYVLRKVNKYLKIIINESYDLIYPENRNSTLIKQILKERAIEYCNHKKDEAIILTEETDCFGTLNKLNTIEELINSEIFDNYKTIALYGNWGSGKSSVIETLIDRYEDNEETICIKFNAWKYENEENLPYALLEHIIAELEKNEDIKFEIKMIKDSLLKSGKIVFKSFGVNYGIFNLSFEKIESEKYGKIETLIEKFEELSYILLENNKKLIVFIDELDRCERENILKFLAPLKLFFTSGDNISYICAVDKEAVKEALKHKYNDGERAEEYLEKIFNFSFNMPKNFSVEKFIMYYDSFKDDEIAEKLAKFFEAINFTTPRHLKIVLNKYDYLVKIKTSNISEGLKKLIPDIITEPNKGYLFDTIFTLYFIILYEFYYKKYLEIKNMDDKLNNYVMYFRNIGWDELNNNNLCNKAQKTIMEQILKKYIDSNEFNKSFYNLFEKYEFKPYVNEEFVFKPHDENKTYDELKKLWYKNKELLKLINIFTPMINNKKGEYDIYDISLKEIIPSIDNWEYVDDEFLESPDYINSFTGDSRTQSYRDKCISDFDAYSYNMDDMKETEINSMVYDISKDAIISNLNKYIKQFEYKNNEILIDFCKYLISDEFFEIIEEENDTYNNDYKFKTLFELMETLL